MGKGEAHHEAVAMPLTGQFFGQPARALTRPAQRQLEMARRRRLDQRIEDLQQLRIVVGQSFPAARQLFL